MAVCYTLIVTELTRSFLRQLKKIIDEKEEKSMDRLQLDKNAKLTGRVYFKDEVMWLGLSGSGASFTFDGTKLVLKLKGDNIAVGENPIDYARIAVYVDGKRVVDEMIDCAEKEVTVIDRTENARSVVEIIKLSESPMSAVGIEAFAEGSAELCLKNRSK